MPKVLGSEEIWGPLWGHLETTFHRCPQLEKVLSVEGEKKGIGLVNVDKKKVKPYDKDFKTKGRSSSWPANHNRESPGK